MILLVYKHTFLNFPPKSGNCNFQIFPPFCQCLPSTWIGLNAFWHVKLFKVRNKHYKVLYDFLKTANLHNSNFPPKIPICILAGNSNFVSLLFSRIEIVLCNACLALLNNFTCHMAFNPISRDAFQSDRKHWQKRRENLKIAIAKTHVNKIIHKL